MAAVFSYIPKRFVPCFLPVRLLRMSAQLRAEKAIEELKEKNPYYEKYASKIATLQKTSPEEFIARVDKIDKTTTPKNVKSQERKYTELLNPKPASGKSMDSSSELPHKKLSDIMKLDLVQNKTVEEIKHIWLEYHKDKPVLVATLVVDQLEKILQMAKLHPVFLFPLPRSQGYEFFVMQFAANTVHFTPLLCYQVHKENAPECLNIVHYTELRDQNLILMRGEYDANVISAQEAQCLVNQMQLYYGQNIESKIKLLEKFTKSPDTFKHMDLIKELENLTIQ